MKEIYGSICTHSLTVAFPKYTRTELNDLFHKYGNGHELQLDKHNWNDISKEDKYLILTDTHEFDHFFQLISSQFGILLFRLHHIISSDISWLGKEFDSLGLKIDNTGTKFTKWLQETGLASYYSRAKLTKKKLDIHNYIKLEFLPGLQSIETLLIILTSKSIPKELSSLTIGEFCNLLNLANSYLRKRSDICIEYGTVTNWEELGFHWESNLPKDVKLFDQEFPFLSFSNLLEVSAYFKEYRMLTRQGANKLSIDQWFKERVPIEYHDLFHLFIEAFGSPSSARAVISSYFDSSLDICSDDCTNTTNVSLVEEEWPFFMFSPIIDFNDLFLKRKRLAIYGYSNIVNRNILFGTESAWRNLDPRKYLKETEFNSHLLTLEVIFLKAVKRKLKAKIDEENENYSQLYLSDLLMTIESKNDYNFRNIENISDKEAITKMIELSFSVLHSYIPLITNRILEGKPIGIPLDKFTKLKSTLNYLFGDLLGEKLLNEFFDFVEQFYKEKFIENAFKGFDLQWYVPTK